MGDGPRRTFSLSCPRQQSSPFPSSTRRGSLNTPTHSFHPSPASRITISRSFSCVQGRRSPAARLLPMSRKTNRGRHNPRPKARHLTRKETAAMSARRALFRLAGGWSFRQGRPKQTPHRRPDQVGALFFARMICSPSACEAGRRLPRCGRLSSRRRFTGLFELLELRNFLLG